MSGPLGNVCDICNKQIAGDKLMCIQHWRMVPVPLQASVKAYWKAVQARKGSHEQQLTIIATYRRHREAAVQAVRDAAGATS